MTQLTILHINDLHGRVGQLLRIATLVRRIRNEVEGSGGYCLFLDGGDAEDTSNLESSLTKGSAVEAMLRGAGCDHVVLGNAIPLRYGPESVENLAAHFGRPLLCGNLFDQHGNIIKGLVPYAIVSFGSLKTGLIGLTDPMEIYRTVFKLDARSPEAVLPGLIERVRSQGAKFIILLSHLSSLADQRVADHIPGIDVIIGGHDHKLLYPPLVINGTVIAQAGEYGGHLGRLDLEIDEMTGKVLSHSGRVIPVDGTVPIDPRAQAAAQEEQERAQEIMRTRVGFLESPVALSYDAECAAGNLLADALLDRMEGAQAAMVLGGHWSSGLEAGELTRGMLFAANRSTANPARLVLTGKQILTFMREARKPDNVARRLHALRGGGVGMPHVAGMQVRYDPADENFLEIQVGDKLLTENEEYIVASTDMEFAEFINYLLIPDENIEYELPTIMPEVLEDYIRKKSPLALHVNNRITSRKQQGWDKPHLEPRS